MENDEVPWWQTGVIYQVYPRSFADSNGDGIGDLRGVLGRLDYLRSDLGVDAIWISPIYPSPNADFGYDISDYENIDPIFGSLDDFDALVAAAHGRQIRIILDLVPNHTSIDHPWFRESKESRDSPKRDWYVWADAKPDGAPPNNWLSVFGGTAWQWEAATGQYYLHSFLVDQPDLNWRNPELKAAMFDVMRFWLDRGVDGFRIDTAHYIMKDPQLRDNPPASVPDSTGMYDPAYSAQAHIHDKAFPDIHELFREIRRFLDGFDPARPRLALGEIYETHWPTWGSYYGKSLDGLHMPYNFGLILAGWSSQEIRESVRSTEAVVPSGAWPNYVLGNHDRHRIASRIGSEQARVAMMLLLTLRGTPTLYYGDELGMHDAEIPPERRCDPLEWRFPGEDRGRDAERTPMQWDTSDNAGFCAAGVQPWLPLPDDFHAVNLEAQRHDDSSMFSLTRALLHVRRHSDALTLGTYRPLPVQPDDVFSYERSRGGETLLIALNFGTQPRKVSLPMGSCNVVISTHMDRTGPAAGSALTLRSHEGCLLRVD